jgi:hypothetical protein
VVDWKEVERLRSKGMDWESIAESPRVKFSPPEGSGSAGRALKTLYLARKSQRSRSSRGQSVALEEDEVADTHRAGRNRWLFMAGLALALLFAIWATIAIIQPAPYNALVAYQYLLVGLVVGGILLAAGFVLGLTDLRTAWLRPLVVGVVLGLACAGVSGYAATSLGYLNLKPDSPIGNTGWDYASNSVWSDGGKPVVLFVGSAACPYCSASSWAIAGSLNAYGALTGTGTTTSSPTDTYANTPEMTLYNTNYASSKLAWHVYEDSYNQAIHLPSLPNDANSYMLAYNNGPSGPSIPFMVAGGQFIHVGSLVDPGQLCVGQQSQPSGGTERCTYGPYTPSEIQSGLNNASSGITNPGGIGTAVQAILTAQYFLEAVYWKADVAAGITPPASVTQNGQVQADFQQLTVG